jgi:BED zinc finger
VICVSIGLRLNLDTSEVIQRIEIDASAEAPTIEQPIKKRKPRDTLTSPVWAHFKRGEILPNGSYTVTCTYCGRVYPMGNQKGTSNMKNHIKRGCKLVSPSKRHKPDVLQILLQVGSNTGQPTLTYCVSKYFYSN